MDTEFLANNWEDLICGTMPVTLGIEKRGRRDLLVKPPVGRQPLETRLLRYMKAVMKRLWIIENLGQRIVADLVDKEQLGLDRSQATTCSREAQGVGFV